LVNELKGLALNVELSGVKKEDGEEEYAPENKSSRESEQ
jgi:hypothetical protein